MEHIWKPKSLTCFEKYRCVPRIASPKAKNKWSGIALESIAVYLKSPRRRQATKFMSKTVVKSFQPIKKPLQLIETHFKLTWNQFKTHSKLPKTHSKALKTQWKPLTTINKYIFTLFEHPFWKIIFRHIFEILPWED